MVSGFWVVKMTDRARLISAFITPFGLFEWNRMPFGLKNAPQIYQLIGNALYGFTQIPKMAGDLERLDLFEARESEDPGKPSVLGRRSYIDDILVPADDWDQLCDCVEDLLEACNKWNLSICVVKSFWGMPKVAQGIVRWTGGKSEGSVGVDGSRVSRIPAGDAISLNYYSRFIEDYVIYASVLYELRGIDYAAMEKGVNQSRIQLALAVMGSDA
ncbi:reverse transcriptase [Phytophthora megakarya]|uniref:Reverse transcriptase n=1 Tax=Phytophthora megakarya TaxID=4795 RepID=A0A225VZT1_9STRA|nr:reverse transcriptase [Phytophthora megakarya]